MRVGQKYMVDPGHPFKTQVADARTGIDEDIIVHQ